MRQCCEPPGIEGVEFDAENLVALLILGYDGLILVVTLATVTKLDLVIGGVDELVFAVWKPRNRVNIIHNILKCLMKLRNNFRTSRPLNFAEIVVEGWHLGVLEVVHACLVLGVLLDPDLVQIFVH